MRSSLVDPAPQRPARPTPYVVRPEASDVSTRRDFAPRRTLVHAGDDGDAVLHLERGLVKLVGRTAEGQDRIVTVLGAGDGVGASEAMSGRPHGVDVVALTSVSVAYVDREAFRRRLAHDPEAAFVLIDLLGRQVRSAWDDLTNAYLPVQTRLAGAILELARRFGEPSPSGRVVVRSGLNHHAFASLIGAQRASVSATMKEFRQAGAATGARGTYVIDVARLAGFAPPADDAADLSAWLPSPARAPTWSAGHATG